jgi:hypothetical protein
VQRSGEVSESEKNTSKRQNRDNNNKVREENSLIEKAV